MGRQLRLAQRGNVDLSFGPQGVATLHSDLPKTPCFPPALGFEPPPLDSPACEKFERLYRLTHGVFGRL